jgi:hypothetical protein
MGGKAYMGRDQGRASRRSFMRAMLKFLDGTQALE